MRKNELTPALVRCLISRTFPAWADLPVRRVDLDGWDNATFRLGDSLSVRLPSADGYVPQIAKEHRWLPALAPALPLPIPRPVAMAGPACGFPRPWSVYRWLEGEVAASAAITDPVTFADDLARFLVALRMVDATGGPAAGAHSFGRGGPLDVYDAEDARGGSRHWMAASMCLRRSGPGRTRSTGLGEERRCGSTVTSARRTCWSAVVGWRPSSTSVAVPSVTQPATRSWPGPGSRAVPGRPSGGRSTWTPTPGRGGVAGRSGRHSSRCEISQTTSSLLPRSGVWAWRFGPAEVIARVTGTDVRLTRETEPRDSGS